MKCCTHCGKRKARSGFYAEPKAADGLMGKCKECHKAAMKRNRRSNPDVQRRDRERAKQPHRRAKAKARLGRWRKTHGRQYRDQNIVNNALRDGKLKKAPCEACGSSEFVFGKLIARRPLRVKWNCARCYHRARFTAAEVS